MSTDTDRTTRRREAAARAMSHLEGFFKRRGDRFAPLRRRLNQARMPVRYPTYLACATLVAAVTGVAVALVVALALWLVAEPLDSIPGGTILEVTGVLGGSLLAGLLAYAVVWGGYYYVPTLNARARGAEIDAMLPHAIAYLYALTNGGVGILTAIEELAESEDAYGEAALEFDTVVRETSFFGQDPIEALQSVRDRTPSDEFAEFLDDLLRVLDSGGDVSTFLAAENDKFTERARFEQESFLDMLSLLAELYVGILVVSPLFAVITLLMLSFLGAQTITMAFVLVYVGLPAATVGFLLLLDMLSGATVSAKPMPEDVDPTSLSEPSESVAGDERLAAYRRKRKVGLVQRVVSTPIASARKEPLRSLYLTVPAAAAVLVAVVLTGTASPTAAAFLTRPVWTTSMLVLAPAAVVTVPLSVLHEATVRRNEQITSQFPDLLHQLANANRRGMTLAEAMNVIASRGTDHLAEEMRIVANDYHWSGSLAGALRAFSARLGIPEIYRTMVLITDAGRVSGELHPVLDIAARDAAATDRLFRERRNELATYVAVIIVSFLIYLLVVVILDASFLSQIELLNQDVAADGEAQPLFQALPIDTYRLVFFHSALVQAVGNGLVAGKMGRGSLLSGLKYGIALSAITVAVFAYIATGALSL